MSLTQCFTKAQSISLAHKIDQAKTWQERLVILTSEAISAVQEEDKKLLPSIVSMVREAIIFTETKSLERKAYLMQTKEDDWMDATISDYKTLDFFKDVAYGVKTGDDASNRVVVETMQKFDKLQEQEYKNKFERVANKLGIKPPENEDVSQVVSVREKKNKQKPRKRLNKL